MLSIHLSIETTDSSLTHQTPRALLRFNELLDTLERGVDSELMEQLVKALPEMELTMDGRTYEILMQLHFLLRDFAEVRTRLVLAHPVEFLQSI